jgi:hypothetical protein
MSFDEKSFDKTSYDGMSLDKMSYTDYNCYKVRFKNEPQFAIQF